MLKNYFKTAWRNLINNKVYSALNIAGLAAGMSIALIIGLWVNYQSGYDRFLPDNERVYKADLKFTNNGEDNVIDITPYPLGTALKNDVPGVQYVAQTSNGSHGLMTGDKKLYLPGIMAGADFLRILKYPLLKGNAADALQDPYSIVLTEATALSLFGKAEPIGKTVRIDNKNNLVVTGVLKNVPANSSLQFNYLVPFDYRVQNEPDIKNAVNNWGMVSFKTYVSLAPNVNYAKIEPALKKIFARYNPADYKKSKGEALLQPLKDWHLYSEFKNGKFSGGFIEYIKMFSVIGILVLVIACINFMNLATARSEKRAREVGVRKALGSGRMALVLQFLTEAILIASCSAAVALLIVFIALPAFNELAKTAIYLPIDNVMFWLLMAGYTLLTGLLAGSRPAFYLSSFRPVKVLKGSFHAGKAGALPRKALVVLQFSCSIALIIGTVIIYQQIRHAKDRDLGYDAGRLVVTDFNRNLNPAYAALKNELLKSGAVTAVTKSSSNVTEIRMESGVTNWPGSASGEELHAGVIGISDADFFKTNGMQFIMEGDRLTNNPAADSGKVIINESAAKKMRLKSPLGQTITWDGAVKLRVVGVVKDALMTSPFSTPMATIFLYDRNWSNFVTYKLSPNMPTSVALSKIAVIFNKYNPSSPFVYNFVDETYAKKFDLELLIGKLSSLFAAFAILISCLGLFGLAAYMAEQRNREIGIRKVLGASVAQVWLLLNKEFVGLVLISSVIASPLAYYFLQNWLQKYAYRISISPMIFVLTGMAAVIITMVTISFQSVKAALVNPAKSLKGE